MPRLDESLLLSLIDKIYDAALDVRRWHPFLYAFSDAFRGPALLFSQDMRGTDAGINESVRIDPRFLASYAEHYGAVNPFRPSMDATAAGTLCIGHLALDPKTWETSEFCNDWMVPQGVYHSTGAVLLKTGSVETNLAIIRSRQTGPFEKEEIAFFRKLVPHLQRAIQVHREIFSIRVQRDSALQGLEGLATGVMLVARECRLLYASPVAERVLRAADGLLLIGGRLRGRTPRVTNELERLVHAAVQAGATGVPSGGLLALPRLSGDALSVLVAPLHVGREIFGLNVPAAIIFIADPDRDARTLADDLARMYGLTPTEAKLLCALLEGSRLNTYADAAGISMNTAWTHLKRIFAKTGQSRQADVIRHVLSNPVARLASWSPSPRS